MTMAYTQDGWILEEATAGGARHASQSPDTLPEGLLRVQTFVVDRTYRATLVSPQPRRGSPPELIIRHPVGRHEACLLAIRHASGALAFHTSTRRLDAGPDQALFRVPIRHAGDQLTIHVLKFPNDAAEADELPARCAHWEEAAWGERQLREGWGQVSLGGPYGLTLTPQKPKPGPKTLILLHGLLSNASATFGPLSTTDFMDNMRASYGDRIYAYNYHSLRRSPEETARLLLESLPAGDYVCDVIAHSTGGLVLRSIVEQHERQGTSESRFHLQRGVLVACPNEGTALGAPARWQQTISWLATLLEGFPVNPFFAGWDFVAAASRWLAEDAGTAIPGVRALDPAGQTVRNLQSSPARVSYSALVSNYHPDPTLWQRAQDVGIDDMFDAASDLMMPSEGGWRIRRQGRAQLTAGRIGCFGAGGNLVSTSAPAHHLNLFGLPETAAFLSATLADVGDKLESLDTNLPLPGRRFEHDENLPAIAEPQRIATPQPPSNRWRAGDDDSNAFRLLILNPEEPGPEQDGREEHYQGPNRAHILASYRGARVMETIRLRREKGEAATSFGQIIRWHRQIKDYTNHSKGSLPSDEELMQFGSLLFNTLFVGNVRRLYDEARSRQRGTQLEIALTSTIPWIDEKPWEFCYDASRASFLATEEILFVRNVLSAVPADSIPPGDGRLRILIASAQAMNLGVLSISEEEDFIRRGFQPLIDAGLVTIDILPRATPETIHRRLEGGRFDVVHFIGHGHFDEQRQEGSLVFEDAYGGENLLGPRSVREIFCGRGLSLVFLNSCESGTAGSRWVNFNLGLAQTLLAHGLPALVANQFAVPNTSATSFARYFYASLARGNTLGQAAREARIAVNYSRHGEPIDWAIPVLYTRDAKLALCQSRKLDFDFSLDSLTDGVRGSAGRRRRIAVWDIDGGFPDLERTLRQMNDAQTSFEFELVDLSTPFDSPDVPTDLGPLDPERVAGSMRSKAVTLGVELLCGVTRQPFNSPTHGWWPRRRKPAVVIVSSSGLKVPSEGSVTDRVIANLLISALAGFFGGAGSHPKGETGCMLALDADRDPNTLASQLDIDVKCVRTLQKNMPRDLPALQVLATLF